MWEVDVILTLGALRARALNVVSLSCVFGLLAYAPIVSAEAPPNGKIGLVFTNITYALHQSPEQTECPAGLQYSGSEQFLAQPGLMEHVQRIGGTFNSRGPGGRSAVNTPMAIEDPLPWKELRTSVGYGFNLDGASDGAATENTCAHEKFTSADGERVDNQMARVLGCVKGWRKSGFMADFYSAEIKTKLPNRYLIEITGVDNEVNDPEVEVTVHKGIDRLVPTGEDDFIPFISHRIDHRFPEYSYKTRGKIVDGVLTTDPIAFVRMPMYQARSHDGS